MKRIVMVASLFLGCMSLGSVWAAVDLFNDNKKALLISLSILTSTFCFGSYGYTGCIKFSTEQSLADEFYLADESYVPVGVELEKRWNISNSCGKAVDVKLKFASYEQDGSPLDSNLQDEYLRLSEDIDSTLTIDNGGKIISTKVTLKKMPPRDTDPIANIERITLVYKIVDSTDDKDELETLSIKLNVVNVPAGYEADVFDFPIGNKGYVGKVDEAWVPYRESFDGKDSYSLNTFSLNERDVFPNFYQRANGQNNTDERWHNNQDTYSYLVSMRGYHHGEDWNYDIGGADAGKEIYSVANGVVIKNETDIVGDGNYGQYIVIMHKLKKPIQIYPYSTQRFSYVFSGYLHLDDKLYLANIGFDDINVGGQIHRGDIIGKLDGALSDKISSHLHLEMMTKHKKIYGSLGTRPYPDGGAKSGEIYTGYLIDEYEFRKFGLFDPSDFINATHNIADNETGDQLTGYPYYWYPEDSSFSKHQIVLSPSASFENPVTLKASSYITKDESNEDDFIILGTNTSPDSSVYYSLGEYKINFERLDGMSVYVPGIDGECQNGDDKCSKAEKVYPAMNKVGYQICKITQSTTENPMVYLEDCARLPLKFDETLTSLKNIEKNSLLLSGNSISEGKYYSFSQAGGGKATFIFNIDQTYQFKEGEFYSIVATKEQNADKNGVALGAIRVFGDFLEEELPDIPETDLPFPDILNSLYQKEIIGLYHLGIVNGNDRNGDFEPEKLVNRAEFAKMLVLAARYAKNNDINKTIDPIKERTLEYHKLFDVEVDSWYEDLVYEAYRAGFSDGYIFNGPALGAAIGVAVGFGPENNILRCEGAKMVVDTFDLFKEDVATYVIPSGFRRKYNDIERDSWYEKHVARCYELGIMGEYAYNTKSFEPGAAMRKDEAAALIYNAYLKSLDLR